MLSHRFNRGRFRSIQPLPWYLPPAHVPLIVLGVALAVCGATPYLVSFFGGISGMCTTYGYGWPWCFCTVSSHTDCRLGKEDLTTTSLEFAVYWWSDRFRSGGSAFGLGHFLANVLVWLGLGALAEGLARATLTLGKRLLGWLVPAKLLSQQATEPGVVDLA